MAAQAGNDLWVDKLPKTALSRKLDGAILAVGNLVSALWLVIMLIILYAVCARYFLNEGVVAVEELQWHLSGAAWITGISYCFVHDGHVRVDLFHERFSYRRKCWVELLGILFLLLPFACITMIELIPYTWQSYLQNERSAAPNGLPMRWLIKLLMPTAFLLLVLAAAARLHRLATFLLATRRSGAVVQGQYHDA